MSPPEVNDNLSPFSLTLLEIINELGKEHHSESFQVSTDELFNLFVAKGWSRDDLLD